MKIKEEFDKRIEEIDIYFDILNAIELDKPKLVSYDVLNAKTKEINFDLKQINIFRASAFLLMYNLVESTVFNSVVEIFDAINSDKHDPKLKYNDVIDDIRKYWLNHLYKHDERSKKETVVKWYMEISNKIFTQSLELISKEIKYGGSIDAANIRKIAQSLGINIDKLNSLYRKDTHGEAFKEIREKRNWLAHGEKTFSEIGKDYPVLRLEDWKSNMIEHLSNYISSVEEYITNESYKRTDIVDTNVSVISVEV